MTVLAVHKGTLAIPNAMAASCDNKFEKFKQEKASMTRDMALTWRMKKFITEIEKDSEVINGCVSLMLINLVCHLVPLYLFAYEPVDGEFVCVPAWLLLLAISQLGGIYYILTKGIGANDMINGGINGILGEWQLRYNQVAPSFAW